MKQEKVNVKVVPDTRRCKDNKRFPLKLRVTHKGSLRYYATGYDASNEEWNIINSVDAKQAFLLIAKKCLISATGRT
jgi:integrase/recombinase XerD